MKPFERSPPRYGLSELYVGRSGGRVPFREPIDFVDESRTTHHMSVPHTVCGVVCGGRCGGIAAAPTTARPRSGRPVAPSRQQLYGPLGNLRLGRKLRFT